MLKGLDPLLSPELLHVLAAMGHGDEIAIVDANFPADSIAADTSAGSAIRLVGVDVVQAVEAILSVLPLDQFRPDPVRMMAPADPESVPDVQVAVMDVVRGTEGSQAASSSLERFAFYEAASKAYAIVATGETRLYGCFLLRKGVIEP